MFLSLHTGCMKLSDVIADIRVARDVGYDGIELSMPKVERYLAAGGMLDDLRDACGPLRITMLDVLLSIERTDARALRDECGRMARIAEQLSCPNLQVVVLNGFVSTEWPSMRSQLLTSLRALADIASAHGVRLALEPVSFSAFNKLEHAVEVVQSVGKQRIGLVLDTWHLWTSNTPWQTVVNLDPALIVCAHIGDSTACTGVAWSDDDRTVLPGDGVVPLAEAVAAIRSTGFGDSWSVELLGNQYKDWHPSALAQALYDRASCFLGRSSHEKLPQLLRISQQGLS